MGLRTRQHPFTKSACAITSGVFTSLLLFTFPGWSTVVTDTKLAAGFAHPTVSDGPGVQVLAHPGHPSFYAVS
jgi:hypothetical protein